MLRVVADANVPISAGHGVYLVCRGEPAAVVELLESGVDLARRELPGGRYDDRRGRPQG